MLNQNTKELPFGFSLESSWFALLEGFFKENQFDELFDFVQREYGTHLIFPSREDVFNAFLLCPVEQVKVVILGQDPYHGLGQAHGLSFSVPPGTQIPRSLLAIFKEIVSDTGEIMPKNGDLTRWARQGVFLLNSILTVRANLAGSHQKNGWEDFSDGVIQKLNQSNRPLVFLLWGSFAQKKADLITDSKHLILKAPHPSPLSSYRGFFGCKHFSQANDFLLKNGLEPIEW